MQPKCHILWFSLDRIEGLKNESQIHYHNEMRQKLFLKYILNIH